MKSLYTAYGFKLDEPTDIRPVGMNTLIHLDIKKAPSLRQQRFSSELAAKRGFDTIVFFKDETPFRTIELW